MIIIIDLDEKYCKDKTGKQCLSLTRTYTEIPARSIEYDCGISIEPYCSHYNCKLKCSENIATRCNQCIEKENRK